MEANITLRKIALITSMTSAVVFATDPNVYAGDIPYNSNVNLKVGQSVVLKGVRAKCDGTKAPSFASLKKLPKPKTGVLSDGGAGTVDSKRCKGRVPGRAVIFTAKKAGSERLIIYKDEVIIKVR